MAAYLLGMDIGTSACKVALHREDGSVVSQQSRAHQTLYPGPGWAEQRPEDWWAGICDATRELLESGVRAADIAGIGIAGQSWSAIPVDKQGTALAATPIWTDTRAKALCDARRGGTFEQEIFSVCGNPFQPTYTLPKMLWFLAHQPSIYQKARYFLQSNSYIACRLTGRFTQDLSQGYGLHCFDMRKGCWDTALAGELGTDASLLPELYPCHAVIGHITRAAAAQTGLLEGTPVVAGGLDAACGTLGAGVLHAGEAQEQGGQAGGMSICLDSYAADPRLIVSRHVVPGRFLLQGGTVGGGGMLRWLREEVCPELSFGEMSELAATVPPGSDGLLCLPYMAGERSPIWDAHAKGVLFGLSYDKKKAHLIRASMEGVAYSLLDNLLAAEQAGAAPRVLRAMGGASGSLVWTQIKADVTGKRIEVPTSRGANSESSRHKGIPPEIPDGDTSTTLGASILAGVGTGVYAGFDEAVQKTVRVSRVHEPSPEAHAVYQRAFAQYIRLYLQTKDIMEELS